MSACRKASEATETFSMAVQDQEALIRQLLGLLGLAHLAFAAVAAKAASDKGLPLLPSVAKV